MQCRVYLFLNLRLVHSRQILIDCTKTYLKLVILGNEEGNLLVVECNLFSPVDARYDLRTKRLESLPLPNVAFFKFFYDDGLFAEV